MDKKTIAPPPKRIDGVSSVYFDSKTFAAKIEYLQQLRQTADNRGVFETSIHSRIDNVCDAIEKDLGISTKIKI
ncbi:hypothetical protein NSS82_10270 [Paenibacillus sp. FSL H7-0735]|uniref:hypothetical protein n=1 Tax=Paenibacillus sp. FSL H7-0735 TaxID=2954736 RepID=UPI0030F8FC62